MNLSLIIATIFAPSLFWILYFRYKDRYKPEPFLNMGFTFLIGFLFGYLCLRFFQLLIPVGIPKDLSHFISDGSIKSFVYLVFIVGFIEELFKLIPFMFIIKWYRNFDEDIDGIIYSSIIAIGFAAYENLFYIPLLSGKELFGRAIVSPLTHTIFASVWGYYTGLIMLKKENSYLKPILAFSLSFFLHGLYDYFSLSFSLQILSSLVILGAWIWRIRIIENEIKLYT